MSQSPIVRKQKALHPHKVTQLTSIAPDIYTLETERKFDFQPGQVVAVGLTPTDEQPRLYSIASGNSQPFLRILFDINPNGYITPHLSQMKPGNTIYISEPFGRFIGDTDEALWIATGTGIAPFISMAESGLAQNKTLLQGARTLDKFLFADYFNQILKKNYLRFCTTQHAKNIIEGRLTTYLQNHQLLNPNIKYYICGSSQMVIDVREILVEQKQIPIDNIVAEIYF